MRDSTRVDLYVAGDRRAPARSSATATAAGRCWCSRPSRAGRATSPTTAWSTRSPTLIEAGRVKLYCVDSYDGASWAGGDLPLEERARRHGGVRVVDRRPGGAVHPRRQRRRRRHHHHGLLDGRLPRAQLRVPARRPVPARDVPLRQLRPGAPGTAGASAATRAYFNNPPDYVGNLHGDHLDWLRSRLSVLLVCGQGQWEDTTGSLESTTQDGRAARRRRASGTSSTCGVTTCRTTGRPGGHSWRTTCRGSARSDRDTPGRAGWPRPSTSSGCCWAPRRTGRAPSRRWSRRLGPVDRRAPGTTHRLRTKRVTIEPFNLRDQPAPRAGHRPAGVLVLPPARVAEEGRADGRRLPAQQPVHVPVDGEARGVLRDDAAGAEGAGDRAGAVQAPARQRPLRVHRGRATTSRSTSTRSPNSWATRCS